MQGRRDGTGRGATIERLAADDRDPWAPLARLVADDLSTKPEIVATLDAAGLTGRERIVVCLYQKWSRARWSYRALAAATGTTPHNVQKTHRRAVRRLAGAKHRPAPETPLEVRYEGFDSIARVMAEPPGPLRYPTVRISDDGDVRGNLRIDRHGTHWPPEKWQPPGETGRRYGRTQFPPQGPVDDGFGA